MRYKNDKKNLCVVKKMRVGTNKSCLVINDSAVEDSAMDASHM